MTKWKLTDDDSFQHVYHEGGSRFSLIEMQLINPDTCEYEVYSNDLDVQDYISGPNKSELAEIMDAFYESKEQFNRSYGNCSETERYQIIAECIFEYKGSSDGYSLFRGSEEECREFIKKYIIS